MQRLITTIAACFIANTAGATSAPDTSLRPEVRPQHIVQAAREQKEIECLALNVYHESRGENIRGQLAVAWVTMNRVNHDYFPDTVCDVVWDNSQFSWTHDNHSDHPHNKLAWVNSRDVAESVYHEDAEDPTDGALFFHTVNTRPVWRHRMDHYVTIENHKFYHWDGNWNND